MSQMLSQSNDQSFFGSDDSDLTVRLMERLIAKNFEMHDRDDKGYILKLASEIPVRIFSGGHLWNLWKEEGSAIEQLMPTLILSIERLLQEVELQQLTKKRSVCHNFNPINFLAQHLHHNNPRYLNMSEMSVYVNKLRDITKELCRQLYAKDKRRLMTLKKKVQTKRQEQAYKNKSREEEMNKRFNKLKEQFAEWLLPLQNKLELKSVKSALHTFVEFSEDIPKEIFESSELDLSLDNLEDTDEVLNCNEFSELILNYTVNMDTLTFDLFLSHLNRCAGAYQYSLNAEQRHRVLTNLFMACDRSQHGVLDRHRVLGLLEQFWDSTTNDIRAILNHPKRWPVVEVEESEYPVDEIKPSEAEVEVETEAKVQDDQTENLIPDQDHQTENLIPDQDDQTENLIPDQDDQTENLIPDQDNQTENLTPDNQTENLIQEHQTEESNTGPTPSEEPLESGNVSFRKNSEHLSPLKESKDELPAQKEDNSTLPETETKTSDTATKPSPGGFSHERSITGSSFVKDTIFEREATGVSLASISAFDEDNLNVFQFVQLMETFMGTQHVKFVFDSLVDFVYANYAETEEERQDRLEKARLEMESAKCKQMTDTLFDKWDNDGAGYLELNQVEFVMSGYKGGSEIEAIKKAKVNLKTRLADEKLSKREFRHFVRDVTKNISGQFEYEYFIDYLTDSVELTQLERVRGNARKIWLNSIITAAKTNGTQLSPVFNTVFNTLYKDAELHGGGKKISAYIALLVSNLKNPKERGENFLHYMAATPDHAEFVKGKILYRDMKGVSFLCVDKGIPVYVPKVKTHGNIHFWNQAKWKTEHNGSFLVIPLKDHRKRVFGVLGIDTTNDPHEKAIFVTHEINFYQGVTKAFSIAYHQVEVRRRVVKILESANRWIHRHCVDVCEICVYIVEKSTKHQDIVLKKLTVTTPKGNTISLEKPFCLERKDSLFRDYLFRCVDNSETVSADAYGQHRLAFPLRDKEGLVSFVVDISIGSALKQLPNYENRELLRMLRLLQIAHKEITNELTEGESCTMILAAEQMTEDLRVEVMFDRLLLLDLRDNVSKLDMQAYAELRSYTSPPLVIKDVLKAVLSIFYQKESEEGLFDDWTVARNYINQQLCQKISQYDPTDLEDLIDVEKIEEKLKDIPQGEVAKHGSVPTEHLFNWLFVCISLIEHLKNKNDNNIS